MIPVEPQVCLLCGFEEREPGEVSPTLIRFKDQKAGEPFGWSRRCRDRIACRARADAAGRPWIVDDTNADVAQPSPASPAVEADAAEVFG